MTIFKCIVPLTKMTFIKNELKILKSFIEEFNTDSSIVRNFSCLIKNKSFIFRCNILENSQIPIKSCSDFLEFRNVDKKLIMTCDGKDMVIEEPKDQFKILLKLLVTIESNNLFKNLKEELTIEDCIELSKGVRSVFSNKEHKKVKAEKEKIPTPLPKTLEIEPLVIEKEVSVNFNVEHDKNLADVYTMLQEVIGNISFSKCKSLAKVVRSCINFCVQILHQKGICKDQDIENKIIQIYKEKGLLSYKSRPKWNGYTVFSEEVRKNDKKKLLNEIGAMWTNLSVSEKERYKNLADIRNKQ